ncbi:MAG: hypothetical protein B6245_02930 [Desulfobacteraceae bacterium 4572_88]|nr:MAG: hypothetical protein B6245_02930 [Desulfobacteraceae bacterium 4572_88]
MDITAQGQRSATLGKIGNQESGIDTPKGLDITAQSQRSATLGKISGYATPSKSGIRNQRVNYLESKATDVDIRQFEECLCENNFFSDRPEIMQAYVRSNIPRLYRIFRNMRSCGIDFKGPSLDVGSGWGILYPVYKQFFYGMLPYHMAELFCYETICDGEKLPCVIFECEKDQLPHEDSGFALVLFFDVLEHLIIDPVYTVLEFNRVLGKGGHLIINTPNAAAVQRVLKIFAGQNPATENEIRPSSIYQRHNREWTPDEVCQLMECCGFGNCAITTNEDMITHAEADILHFADEKGLLNKAENYFGPEIFCIAEKREDRTIHDDLPEEQRWPEWLYTALDIYRRRPKIFPIHAENPETELLK